MKPQKLLSLLLAAVLLTGVLSAQVSTAGRITGTVKDDQGNPLPGVAVAAKSPKLVGTAAAVTEGNGVYRLQALPPGTYTITFTLPGFISVVRDGIVLGIEQALAVDISMKPAAVQEEVVVVGRAPLIDVKSQAHGSVLTQQTFASLPKGRTFDTLVTMLPSVFNEKTLLDGISVDGASGAENMFYVDGTDTTNLGNGTRGTDVSFDFAEEVQFKASGYNAEYGGSVGGVINVITRSGGNAFHGEVLGYFSGTALEGRQRDKLYFDKDDDTLARYYSYSDYVGRDKGQTYEFGLSLGGYIIKDRIWFFGAFTPRLYSRTRTMDLAIQDREGTNVWNRKEKSWNGSLKLTAQPSRNMRVGASLTLNRFSWQGGAYRDEMDGDIQAFTCNPTYDYNNMGFDYPLWSGSAYTDITISNDALLSLRGGYFYSNRDNPVATVPTTPYYRFQCESPVYSSVDNSMFPEIPAEYRHPIGWYNYPRDRALGLDQELRTRMSLNADFTYYLNFGGEHAFKAGAQFMRRAENVSDEARQPIIYLGWDQDLVAFGTNYGRGAYGFYAVRGNADSGSYGSRWNVHTNSWALYLQDSWTIAHRLTLNLGVRAESEYMPSYTDNPEYAAYVKPINFSFGDKLAPRLGFVYDVMGDSSLKIFGSYGIFYDVLKLDLGANMMGGFKWKSVYYKLEDWDFTQIGVDGNFPGEKIWECDWRPPIYGAIDPDLKPFTQREISFGAEKKLMEDMALSLRLVNKKVLWAIEDCGVPVENYYLANPGSAFMQAIYESRRQNGTYLPGTPDMPKAKRDYYAMNLSLDKRFSHGWQGGLSYTLSRLAGNYSGLASSDENGRNSPNGERFFDMWYLAFDKSLNAIDGPLPTDRTHSLKAYGSYVLPFGLTVGLVANAYSGTPVTEEWEVDTPGYYPFNRGNLGRTPFVFFANAYIEYVLRLGGNKSLQFSLNVDNLTDSHMAQQIWNTKYRFNISPGEAALVSGDWSAPSDAVLDPRFGMGYNFLAPISGRLGVRFVF